MSANPRLGRGLAALMGEAPAPSAEAAVPARTLPIEMLEPGPFQPRSNFHADTLAELVDSIRARGILQPLLARPHPKQAGLHDVPVLIRDLADTDAMAASLVENLQRQDLNPIEEGEGFRRLIEEFGLTQEQLGTAVGKSRSHVANAMRLLQLPPSVRIEVQNGRLSAGHARALLAHPDPEQAAKLVIARGLNVRQTEALATAKPKEAGEISEKMRDPETEALERELSGHLGLTVQINFDGRGGALTLKYRSLDQLDGLVALLSK